MGAHAASCECLELEGIILCREGVVTDVKDVRGGAPVSLSYERNVFCVLSLSLVRGCCCCVAADKGRLESVYTRI